MIVEIVSTGTELLLGQIVNTNAPYLAERLNELGFGVLYQSTIGDNRVRMANVLETAIGRADIVITSGGLGPTQGDITKEVAAGIFNLRMIMNEESAGSIRAYFAKRGIAMSESNLRQAMMPEGALVIKNRRGTAPGIILERDNKTMIHLPGPPHELQDMFEQQIAPYLKQRFSKQGVIVSRVLHTFGLGESLLEEKIKDLILMQTNPTIALLVRKGEVLVRLTAKDITEEAARCLLVDMEARVRERIEEYIFGVDGETMEGVAGQLLSDRGYTLALAESCTGGLITTRITDVPGSSAYLIGTIVCYNNSVKVFHVGVPEEVLATYGAVSEETAVHMAQQVRNKFSTDIGIGVTGIAGPGGATDTKPVGLVFVAIDGPNGLQCYQYQFYGERTDIKFRVSQSALDLLRRYIRSCS